MLIVPNSWPKIEQCSSKPFYIAAGHLYLHKNLTWHSHTGMVFAQSFCEAPGYYQTYADAEKYLYKWIATLTPTQYAELVALRLTNDTV